MTREEVKAQLAKCPLEWREIMHRNSGHRSLKAEIKRGDLSAEYRILYKYERFELKRVSLMLVAMADHWECGECVLRKVDNFPTLEEVKAKAEAHRVDLICLMLGIKE
jgi:hypothetical protein|nr:MAG TPA: hypothetical protein [Caudoviricetes sp.]